MNPAPRQSAARWRQHVVCGFILAAIISLLFAPVLFGRATLVPTDILHQLTLPFGGGAREIRVQNHYSMDALTQAYPAYHFFQQCIRQHQCPLWNPYIMGGHPSYSSGIHSFANPFNLIFWFVPMPAAFDLRIVAQFFAAALCMYFLLHQWRLVPAACLLGAVAYALNTQFMMNYWYGQFQTFVWMPLVVLFFERAQRERRTINSVIAGLFAGLAMVSGNIQSAAYVPLTLGLFALGTAVVSSRGHRWMPQVVTLALVCTVGVLVASVQILPTLELLCVNASPRFSTGHPSSLIEGIRTLPFLITFIVPSLWGSTETFDLLKAVHTSSGMFQGYIGIAPFALALAATIAWRESRVRVLWVATIAYLALLFLVPIARRFLYYRSLVVYAFFVAMLAAIGLDQLMSGTISQTSAAKRVRQSMWFLSALLVIVVIGLGCVQTAYAVNATKLLEVSRTIIRHHASDNTFGNESAWIERRLLDFWLYFRLTNPAMWIPLVSGLITVGLIIRTVERGLSRAAAFAIVAITVIDLTPLARQYLPMVDANRFPLYPSTPLIDYLQTSATRVLLLPANSRRIIPDNILMTYSVMSHSGYDSLAPLTMWFLVGNDDIPGSAAAFGVCSVTHALANSPKPPLGWRSTNQQEDGVWVFENPKALPRSRFITHYVPVADFEEAKTILAQYLSRNDQTPIIETTQRPVVDQPAYPGSATIVSESPTSVKITVAAAAAGYLLLADTFYPGWHAQVDGRPVAIQRANCAQRAVFLGPGHHDVLFAYQPASVRLGAFITAVTVLLCLIIAMFGARMGQSPSLPKPMASDAGR
jgi:hypothetical protein